MRVMSLMYRDPSPENGHAVHPACSISAKARSVFTVGTQTQAWQRVDVVGSGGQLTIHVPFNAYADAPAEMTVTSWLGTRTVMTPAVDQFAEVFDAFSRRRAKRRPGSPAPGGHGEQPEGAGRAFQVREVGDLGGGPDSLQDGGAAAAPSTFAAPCATR